MHLALVTHNVYVGDGQGRVNRELVRYLLRNGVRVTLVADRIDEALVGEGAAWAPVHPGFERIDLLKVARFERMANAYLDRHRARFPPGSPGAFDAVMGCGVVLSRPHALNAVHFVHGTWLRSPFHASKARPGVNGAYQYAFSALNAHAERRTFALARTVVAVSAMVRDELVEIGVPEGKVEVVVNGVDPAEYRPLAEGEDAGRAALGLPEGVVLGLFAGDIRSPIKNLDGLLRALTRVPGVHLAVAGRPDGSPYPALAQSLGLGDRVRFLGFRRDTAAIMRACDFFALASRRDSCPLVLLEALASGLPAVTAPTVGTHTLVAEGERLTGTPAGIVVGGPDDHEGIADAFRTLAAEPERRAAMGRSARAVALAHTWDRMSAGYLALLERHAAHSSAAHRAPADAA